MTLSSNLAAMPEQHAYEPPTLTVLGSVEEITRSSVQGSLSDSHGRINKNGH
ncbi:MAG: lasso RiPP family leader peptide-containing protein [Actinomycetota bacterium]